MSLIICSECGKEISENAQACPHCGNPMIINTGNVDTSKDFVWYKSIVVVILLIITLVCAFLSIYYFALPAMNVETRSSQAEDIRAIREVLNPTEDQARIQAAQNREYQKNLETKESAIQKKYSDCTSEAKTTDAMNDCWRAYANSLKSMY